tara:strand:+ start:616 stop:1026 length:411 start_codon:yes stop_codon:yes gene_type:complete
MLNKEPIPRVWINGTFDVLHPGHVKLFRYARILAGQHGKIHVGIDTDERVSLAKGPSRPVNSLSKRISNLASTMEFDSIMSFATDTELKALICATKPKFMVIGDDYRNKAIVGSSCIKNIFYVTRDENSSTKLIEQ